MRGNVVQINRESKACTKCGIVKPYSEFHKHSTGGLQPRCKSCRKQAAARPWPDKRKNVVLTEDGRTCLICNEAKSWDEFSKDVRGFNQKTATCKVCRNIKSRKVYQENPNVRRSGIKNRPDKLKRLYGITYEEVVHTLARQYGRCANVGCCKEISLDIKGTFKNRAVIDHDHKTGKFRALLCLSCNMTLGVLETKEKEILGLMDYINKYR